MCCSGALGSVSFAAASPQVAVAHDVRCDRSEIEHIESRTTFVEVVRDATGAAREHGEIALA
jgi:hypothetical protein